LDVDPEVEALGTGVEVIREEEQRSVGLRPPADLEDDGLVQPGHEAPPRGVPDHRVVGPRPEARRVRDLQDEDRPSRPEIDAGDPEGDALAGLLAAHHGVQLVAHGPPVPVEVGDLPGRAANEGDHAADVRADERAATGAEIERGLIQLTSDLDRGCASIHRDHP
jgi:hypothetical protein